MIDNVIRLRRQDYYNSINLSTKQASDNPFIIFILEVILESILNFERDIDKYLSHLDSKVKKFLDVLSDYTMSAKDIMQQIELKSINSFRKSYLNPAIKLDLIGLTIPQKSTSRNHKYYKK